MINRIVVFIGWGLSSMSFIIALAGLATPGTGKFISLAFVGWALIFSPPLWKKTVEYGLLKNIGIRVVAFFLFPIIFTMMAMVSGYQPESSVVNISPSPIKTEVPKLLPKNTSSQIATSSVAISSTPNPLPKDVNPAPKEIQPEVSSINVFSSTLKTEESPSQKNTSSVSKEIQPKAATSSIVASTHQPAINTLKSRTVTPKEEPTSESMTPTREATQGQGCSCPYDLDKRGNSCGGRSAYSKPGGASPACYRKDR